MGRGKLKYRDVVGRGASRKKKKNVKGKNRFRKTFSLYNLNDKKSLKQKNEFKNEDYFPKKLKVGKKTGLYQVEEEESSGSEEENDMQQLRNMFSSKKKNQFDFIISSEDESEEEEIINKNEEHDSESNMTDTNSAEEVIVNVKNQQDEEENHDNMNDPFIRHLCFDLHESVLQSLQSLPVLVKESVEHWPSLGTLVVQIPQFKETKKTGLSLIDGEKKMAPPSSVPQKLTLLKILNPEQSFIKTQIINSCANANPASFEGKTFTDLQCELFSVINNYQDIYFSQRNFNNAEEIRFVYCLHAVNHILKTRLKIVHHNARLSKKDDVPEDFRDQGLVRPKILIVAPFKNSAKRIIEMIINILLPNDKAHVINKKRFLDEYSGNEIVMPKKNPKPEDYELTFSGNTSDDFKIGVTVTKKSLKLYADFYSSDIIVASPLGLRTIIGAEGEAERNYDFLASIELLILDQVELFFIQNWDHLAHIFNHIHLQPKGSHGTDFSRVRTWGLNGWSKYYRQTLLFSSITLPEFNAIFNKKCNNYAGKVRISNPIEFGAIRQVYIQIPHVFHKFEAESVQHAIERRLEFFVDKILPQQKDPLMKQTLIFVSSYFDYVRLRNFFKKEDVNFVQICEYSKEAKVARARDMFYHGDAHFLLYTERYHFFNRIRIKGIRQLVFYELPAFFHFYEELCNLMQETNMNKKIGSIANMSVNVLYSKYDIHRLSAVVGTERAMKMLTSERKVHMMVTGAE